MNSFEIDSGEKEIFPAAGESSVPMTTEEDEDSEMPKEDIQLEEKLLIDECFLFQTEQLAPIFCKPKLLPLKTITTQKLEKMQKEQMEKVMMPEKEKSNMIIEEEEEEQEAVEEQSSTSEKKEADVWTADD